MKPYLLPVVLSFALAACNSSGGAKGGDAAVPPGTGTPVSTPSTVMPDALDDVFLGAYHWRLTDAADMQGQRIDALFVRADQPVRLNFKHGRLDVANTCNRMRGSYTLAGGKLRIGNLASTMMACADEKLAALDQEISSRLNGDAAVAQQTGDPPGIVLTTSSGDVLTLAGAPTAETRYGGEGETVFLEVGPETRPCRHPPMPDTQCLQVREIKYDDAGAKAGEPGEWENFDQDIEGYTHETGIRNVLRTKRHEVKNPPADAPNTAYVLDMVVESEQAAPKK
ncbi:MAG: META and DUF4377 domain-containing protein [Xanthomonadaceae bacterium]|jgi:heat shock protein HslJ|nr:META and DUF4377 domain-containing protein [Xanthomonadaceae bacterium]